MDRFYQFDMVTVSHNKSAILNTQKSALQWLCLVSFIYIYIYIYVYIYITNTRICGQTFAGAVDGARPFDF